MLPDRLFATIGGLMFFWLFDIVKCQLNKTDNKSEAITSPNVRKDQENLYTHCSTGLHSRNSSECCMGIYGYDDSDSCIEEENCKYFIHYYDDKRNETSDKMRYTMDSTNNEPHYFAYGLSLDERMGHDIVIVCELTANFETRVYLTYNTVNRENIKLNFSKTVLDKFLTVPEASYSNGKLRCQFDIAISFSLISEKPSFNFTMSKPELHKYFSLLAAGTVKDNSLMYHGPQYTTAYGKNKWGYTNSCRLDVSLPKYIEEKIHVSVMALIFMLAMPLTTLFTRFSKGDDKVVFKALGPRWKCIHVFWGFVILCLSAHCFIPMIKRGTFLPAMDSRTSAHIIPGLICYFLIFFQVLFPLSLWMFYDERVVNLITKIHAWQGILTQNLGFVLIIFAPYYTYHITCAVSHIGIAWIIIYYALELVLTLLYKLTDSDFGYKNRVICVYPMPIYSLMDYQYPRKQWRFVIRLMLVFFCVLFPVLIINVMLADKAFGPACFP